MYYEGAHRQIPQTFHGTSLRTEAGFSLPYGEMLPKTEKKKS